MTELCATLGSWLYTQDGKFVSGLISQLDNTLSTTDITRCGITADLILNRLYFSDETESQSCIVMYFFHIPLLKKKRVHHHNLVSKLTIIIWDKKQLNTDNFVMPWYEHTYLIDFGTNENPSHIIQSAFEQHPCSVRQITPDLLNNHLNLLAKFDRETTINSELSSLVDFQKQDFPDDITFVGQIISFTSYLYNWDQAWERIQILIK
eukprot:TRINITY_DN6381_c0_g1_i1.p1 TRINITY_DN6381_c0_g1~~TRINITY_DN6381_c0_g1_i1.p1  ORF type:complete len:207 (-),score=17.81 TRINITY_DN6381_c0_g1_i1:81-701(-)